VGDWEFWIDVGGTFTDCLGQTPDGNLHRHKTLSSGAVTGIGVVSEASSEIHDPARCADPPDFWNGWTFRGLTETGRAVFASHVRRFDASTGNLQLDDPLPPDLPDGKTLRYELRSALNAPLVAIRYLLKCPIGHPLPRCRVRLGTTRGTNALLTRSGAQVAWVTTRGFRDVLEIGYQTRPELFALNIRKPPPLYRKAIEIDERLAADGMILHPLDLEQARRELLACLAEGIHAIAIGLLHAHQNPVHELQLAQLARDLGFQEISISSHVSPLIKLVTRGDTTVVNAYLNPVLRDYLRQLEDELGGHEHAELRLMTSTGGLVSVEAFEGKDSILSGPAGGVLGCAGVAQSAGFERAIGFDMGGTSTDVARFDGQFPLEQETEKAGVRLSTPMLAIQTVAAGGGSICRFDGVKLSVGPDSAGADPGPACYGHGGPLTVTDMNVLLGRIPVDAFPFPLDHASAQDNLQRMAAEILAQTGQAYTTQELAEGFLRIANTNMAQAIRSVSIAQGCDPRDYVLVAFGGAAPQHACAVAAELGIDQILIHPDASLLSAVGIGLADVARHAERGIYRPLDDCMPELSSIAAELERETTGGIRQEGISTDRIRTQYTLELRYANTDWSLTVPWSPDTSVRQLEHDFAAQHQALYGYLQRDRILEVAMMRVVSIGSCGWSLPLSRHFPALPPSPHDRCPIRLAGQSLEVARYAHPFLEPGMRLPGPALVVHQSSTTLVEDGWVAEVLEHGELLLHYQHATGATPPAAPTTSDPITLEIFHRHFESIASQMGITLRNTSSSVNVKERLDFSCALFTAQGDLVVNAPHIPVHLGAMSQTVKQTLLDQPDLGPGDVIVTNDPFHGGSHLPDVTVITPVFDARGTELRFLVANRAHHAEIGGLTPGSMPPFSRWLAEEGVLIRNFKLVERGVSRIDQLRNLLQNATYPTRDVGTNLADLRAQVAANQQGVRDLHALEARYGWPVVAAYMHHIQAAAEQKMRQALRRLGNQTLEFEDFLDDGAKIRVRVSIRDDKTILDFSGSAPVQSSNLNANIAIVTAAVMYTLRCLMDEPIPLNQGVLAPIELRIPSGILNPPSGTTPQRSPAVAGGNVETSQRIVDCLLGAFRLAAASQGTMNNLLFGNEQFGYYETICGGSGATATSPGASAVHTHMTNTRLTDPEVLETRFPVRIHEFAIRRGSGGSGQHPGGDGVIRRMEFLAPLELSLITQRRGPYPPYGMNGGEPGMVGRNELQRHDGSIEVLAGRAHTRVEVGDQLIIATPGGGGWGKHAPFT
jgi:5-oxoprolinase (ATP-hydrolysing)